MLAKLSAAHLLLFALPCLARQPQGQSAQGPAADAGAEDYQTVVTAGHRPRRVLPCSVEITARQEIARARARTLAEVVEGKPGISFESDGPVNARIGIRGLARERVSLLLDGSPQLLIRNAGTDVPIDPWDVERIEIIKGASALARAPGGVGGLVNVILRRPELPDHGWSAGLEAESGFSSAQGAFHEAIRGHLAGRGLFAQVSGTASHTTGNVRAGEGLEIPNTDHRLFTGSLIAGSKTRDRLIELTYYGRFGVPVGTYRSKLYQDPDLRQIVSARLRQQRLGPFGTVELRASYMRFDVDFRFLADDLRTTKKWFIGEWNNIAVEGWAGLDLLEGHDLSAGVNFYWTPTRRWQESASRAFVGELFPDAARLSTGLFLQDRITVGDWLLVAGVVRLDYDRLSHGRREVAPGSPFEQAGRIDRVRPRSRDYPSVSGNLGANVFPLAAPLTLRLNVGTAVAPPVPGKFSVFVPATPAAPGRVGNPGIAAERSLNLELGGRYAPAATTLDATVFATTIFNSLAEHESRSLRDPLDPTLRYRTFANQDALIYGAELGFRRALLGPYLELRATVSCAVGSYLDPLPDSLSDDTDLPLVPPLRGFVALQSRPLRGLHLRVRARYAAAQRRNSEVAGELPTPMYARLDLDVDYTLRRLWSLERLTLYLSIRNATDMAYSEHTAQYTGVAVGFEEAYLQPGIDARAGLSLRL